MHNVNIIPTNGFGTVKRGDGELLTLNIRSCVGVVLISKNGVKTLGHIANFNFFDEIFVRKSFEDIFNDFTKNGGIIDDCKVYLCGYKENVSIADEILKREYSNLPEAEKYFNSYKRGGGSQKSEDLLLIKVNDKNELIIEKGDARKPNTLLSLNTNKLMSEERDFIKQIDTTEIDEDYQQKSRHYNNFMCNMRCKDEEEEVKILEEFYGENPMENAIKGASLI